MSEMPLSGLTVLELGHSIAAPYAGLVLAELGAEVIKVERTGVGDPVRDWGPPYTDGIATASAPSQSCRCYATAIHPPAWWQGLKALNCRAFANLGEFEDGTLLGRSAEVPND